MHRWVARQVEEILRDHPPRDLVNAQASIADASTKIANLRAALGQASLDAAALRTRAPVTTPHHAITDAKADTVEAITAEISSMSSRINTLRSRCHSLEAASSTVLQRALTASDMSAEAASRVRAATREAKAFLPATGRICRIEGCDRPHKARGLCGRHYARWRRGTL